jgi:hypothetical protein
MPVHHDNDLCLNCHLQMDARPATQPQINPRQHVEDQDVEYGEGVCFECHEPHEPM